MHEDTLTKLPQIDPDEPDIIRVGNDVTIMAPVAEVALDLTPKENN